MNNIIETIELGFGLPINSRTQAIQEYGNRAQNGAFENYGNVLRGILGIDCQELENEDHARIQVGYVIELAIGAHLANKEIDPKQLYDEATSRAKLFVKDNPWHFAKKMEEVKLDADGKPKAKKGAKQVKAYEVYCRLVQEDANRKTIIQAFQDEVNMTKAGATTYFYNMKKRYEKENS